MANGTTPAQAEYQRGFNYIAERLSLGVEECLLEYDLEKAAETEAFRDGGLAALAEYRMALILRHCRH